MDIGSCPLRCSAVGAVPPPPLCVRLGSWAMSFCAWRWELRMYIHIYIYKIIYTSIYIYIYTYTYTHPMDTVQIQCKGKKFHDLATDHGHGCMFYTFCIATSPGRVWCNLAGVPGDPCFQRSTDLKEQNTWNSQRGFLEGMGVFSPRERWGHIDFCWSRWNQSRCSPWPPLTRYRIPWRWHCVKGIAGKIQRGATLVDVSCNHVLWVGSSGNWEV